MGQIIVTGIEVDVSGCSNHVRN